MWSVLVYLSIKLPSGNDDEIYNIEQIFFNNFFWTSLISQEFEQNFNLTHTWSSTHKKTTIYS